MRTENVRLVCDRGWPVGLTAATAAAALGKTVALVDRHHVLGGGGANTGTVPSKTLRETAVVLSGMRSRDLSVVKIPFCRKINDFRLSEDSRYVIQHSARAKAGIRNR